MPVLKLFVPKVGQAALLKSLAGQVEPIARYDAFVVLRADAATARRLSREHPVEDISDQYRLPLGGSEVDPLQAAARPRSRSRSRAAVPQTALDAGPHHHLVQFIGPVKAAWLTALKKAGATLRHPTAGFGQVVRADGAALQRIRALPFVRWTGHLPHADRLAPSVTTGSPIAGQPRRRVVPGTLTVDAFDARDLDRIAQAAIDLGFELLARDPAAARLTVRHGGKAAQRRLLARQLAAVHGVRWIGERVLARTCNNVAAGILRRAAVAAPPLSLTGEGEIVAVCDTGLDSGRKRALHPDFAGRVLAIKSYPVTPDWDADILNPRGNDGAADTDSGHGTHVAGSVLGNGAASATGPERIEGIAPAAQLLFQAVEQRMQWKSGHRPKGYGEFELTGLPADLTPLLRWAYRRGARIHNNSWGGGDAGAYDANCEQVDAFVWQHKDFCFVVAAGNDGTDRNRDGRIDEGSVASPGTAKNVITVGASENERPEFSDQLWGVWWKSDYREPPIRDDAIADDAGQVAALSSRGPTADGRIKPDVLAPGTFILSTRSRRLAPDAEGWAAYGPNPLYMHEGGTSMATPLVSGCVALIREHLRKARGLAAPSAALLKAVLIAGAQRLGRGSALADPHQGYGRVNLERSLRGLQLVAEGGGLRTGEQRSHPLQLAATAGRTLRIVLAYSDWPGTALINNLNLIVVSPAGRTHIGNLRAGSGPLLLDGRNNVEIVQVPAAQAGRWRIEVVGSNVTQGPQDYALAAVLV
jgi:serine protease AprX